MDQRVQRGRNREAPEAATIRRDSGTLRPEAPLPAAFRPPEAGFTPPPPEALSTFVRVIEGIRYFSPELPAWWLATAIKRFDGHCAYCGQETGREPDIDAVIPVVAGGPQRPDAAVLTCKGCKQRRRRRDLLLWKPDVSAKLRVMRTELALDAWNHLSRDPGDMRTPEKAAEVIRARWQHPRFYCHGALLPTGGFIGWRHASSVPSSIQLTLVFNHGGWRLRQSLKHAYRRNNPSIIFWMPTRDGALDALWDVIAHNGLVHHATLSAMSQTIEVDRPDPACDWARMFSSIADLVRRR